MEQIQAGQCKSWVFRRLGDGLPAGGGAWSTPPPQLTILGWRRGWLWPRRLSSSRPASSQVAANVPSGTLAAALGLRKGPVSAQERSRIGPVRVHKHASSQRCFQKATGRHRLPEFGLQMLIAVACGRVRFCSLQGEKNNMAETLPPARSSLFLTKTRVGGERRGEKTTLFEC